jgi:hypothetical protein
MNDTQIDDLKQFITATVSQTESRLESRLGGKIDRLEKKVDDGFAAIGDIITDLQDQHDNHEKRLTTLEPHPA